MLVGEPGIGKTRTARRWKPTRALRGGTYLWGRGARGGGAPAYWPGRRHCAPMCTRPTPARWRANSAAPRPELARRIAEYGSSPACRAAADPRDPEQAQLPPVRRRDGSSATLARAPLVMVLDDLHWADRPTLQLLQHPARELAPTPAPRHLPRRGGRPRPSVSPRRSPNSTRQSRSSASPCAASAARRLTPT